MMVKKIESHTLTPKGQTPFCELVFDEDCSRQRENL